jgi:ferredoxin-type protein NapH
MNLSKLRVIIASAVFATLSIGLIVGISTGTLSGFGWDDLSALCPLGALATMIATRTFIPRAVISIIIMALLVLVVGRAFCGWVCPVPLLERVRGFFHSPKKRKALKDTKRDNMLDIAKGELGCTQGCPSQGNCAQKRSALDSRHFMLGGVLLSTAVFGFPVFCLVCPIGLTFATVLVTWRLFAAGDVTWSIILVPLLLVVELVFLRKWCTRICPLAGLMNLASRFSRTLKPIIDDKKCLETHDGTPCSRCAMACDADINLRHPDFGERSLADCTRCRACLDACPAGAISMPLLVSHSIKASGGLKDTKPPKKGND